MSLSPGARFGAYEIVSLLGVGGMGEVYRARDTKLGREIAIKVLPEALAADADRIARFEREARALAALNHPRIATLHGMEESGGRHFLVMELVEGETLADRLERGALPLEDALRLALQIAEALEAAHEKSIVHRDLKPANVKMTADDTVKVLDFGLAKLGAGEAGGAGQAGGAVTHSPTLSMLATQAGVILGTAAYMSPEQAKGLPADHRSDVFSFGIVFYEMLTGRQPFQGETAPDIMASVLAREPDLDALPAGLNPRLADLIKRCLEKQPKKRWQAVGDLRAEIETVAASPRHLPPVTAPAHGTRSTRIVPLVAAILVSTALTSGAWWYFRPKQQAPQVARFTVSLPEGQRIVQNGQQLLTMSPDGLQVAYFAGGRLYVRSLSEADSRPLAVGSGDAPQLLGAPVFSPDGHSLVFWEGGGPTTGAIKKIPVTGGAAVTICEAGFPYGMSWDHDTILFGQQDTGILRVSAKGGQPELVVPAKAGVPWGPQLLPDGDSLLFTLATSITMLSGATAESWDKAQIVAQSLKTGARKTLISGGLGARYVSTGHIVYAVSGVLFAVPFDARRLEVTGAQVPVVEGVGRPLFGGAAPGTVYFSVSDTGSLTYISGPASISTGAASLAMLDKGGTLTTTKLPPGPYTHPRVSPDGKALAFNTSTGRDANVFIYDLSGANSPRQLTFIGRNRFPIWADGLRVAFQSDREGDNAILWQLVDGTRPAERLTKPDPGVAHVPASWSPDGKMLLFDAIKDSHATLWMLSLPDKKATQFSDVQSLNPSTSASFSHDGRWVAYTSSSGVGGTGSSIFVQPFPATGAKYRITNGLHPLWSRDDTELSYIRPGGGLQIVRIATRPSPTAGDLIPIASTATGGGSGGPRTYDRTPDDARFVIFAQAGASTAVGGQIQVVLNWSEELKARVPVK